MVVTCWSQIRTKEGIEALTEFLDQSGAFTKTGTHRTTNIEPAHVPLGIGEELDIIFRNLDGAEVTLEADWREEVVDSDDLETAEE
ncbi:hypothetical protein C8R41DRAFT_818837 [Lentinula lateritia]|uniref:Amphi-Trp domain-containing protein n=1 Tax=Lentinula lateritia TaxID=40482 RepID=A0ABQ8VPN4_9AGAR|nr:hypothetical protein C8R41DRAFT_818837 [Lentinula lateritia]